METITIKIDEQSLESINAADNLKFDLECKGYKVIDTQCRLFSSVIVMGPCKQIEGARDV